MSLLKTIPTRIPNGNTIEKKGTGDADDLISLNSSHRQERAAPCNPSLSVQQNGELNGTSTSTSAPSSTAPTNGTTNGFPAKINQYTKVLSLETINPCLIEAEYAVRGKIVTQGLEYVEKLKDPTQCASLPFKNVIQCNIGNPHALGQTPMTFPRQILSLMNYPALINLPNIESTIPADVIKRAEAYHREIPAIGAYSHSQGVQYIREEVCDFLKRRDGHAAAACDIFLTDGASQAVQAMLRCLIHTKKDGILVPIPQYPLYSACITLNGGTLVPYVLNEKKHWGLDLEAMRKEIQKRRVEMKENVRALVIINPGNPTGQCLSYDEIKRIIEFAKEQRLVIMADEVYQENVYSLPEVYIKNGGSAAKRTFISFKKVIRDMKEEDVELVSFHSTSKGFLGECGRRGGYMELVNFAEEAKQQIRKLVSISLCSNIEGQLMVAMMVNPPKSGDPSYPLYEEQKNNIIASLERRSHTLYNAFNRLPAIECNPTEGAMYLFPRILLSEKAIQVAQEKKMAADAFYCTELLNETGIIAVPGSGFGQETQTWHFRMTILPSEDSINDVVDRFSKFHEKFMALYR